MRKIISILLLIFALIGCNQENIKEQNMLANLDKQNGAHGFFVGDSIDFALIQKYDGLKSNYEANSYYLKELDSLKIFGLEPTSFNLVYDKDILRKVLISFEPKRSNVDTLMRYMFDQYGLNYTRTEPTEYTSSIFYFWETEKNKVMLDPGMQDNLFVSYSSPYVDSLLYEY